MEKLQHSLIDINLCAFMETLTATYSDEALLLLPDQIPGGDNNVSPERSQNCHEMQLKRRRPD